MISLDQVMDPERGSTLREEAGKLTSALCDHGKAQLARTGLDNDKIEAEVRRLYAQMDIDHAEARKKSAEADTLAFTNAVKKLRLVLGGTTAMLIGDLGEEALFCGRQIDEFLQGLKELAAR